MTEKNNATTIKLTHPIKRGDKEYFEISVIKPTVPALKGLKMLDVMQSDVTALTVLLPRITQPMLHKNDFDTMEISDFVELVGAAIGFLAPSSETTETETNPS
ncbi:phage tail assembly protein [Caviibacterium pharyngocola]|uniref:Phage tail assembly protein n=1 Tax=Caviibacterium pharyngocola TaxID=28159 RepID=A0A2M8RTE8_9PAST|nr:phage tail assembly protein [Caviibacterium pharyngocola]PJG82134.1 phage tail assembly protein [Caviibacterium pharyngocola]